MHSNNGRKLVDAAKKVASDHPKRVRLLGGAAAGALLLGGFLMVSGDEPTEPEFTSIADLENVEKVPSWGAEEADVEVTPASGADELTFDEAEITEEVEEPVIVMEPVEKVPGWRVQALGYVGDVDEVDVAAGLENVSGVLASWNSLSDLEIGHSRALVADGAANVPTDVKAALEGMMGSLQNGVAGATATPRGTAQLSEGAFGFARHALVADGEIQVEQDGVYEFRVISWEWHRHGNHKEWSEVIKAPLDVAIEVAGSTAFGGSAARKQDKKVVPEALSLQAGTYPISVRAAPQNHFNIAPATLRVEYRIPGVRDWSPVSDILESRKVEAGSKDRVSVAPESIEVTHSTPLGDRCKTSKDLSLLPEAYVNAQPAEPQGALVPVAGCQLTTLNYTLVAKEPGDYFLHVHLEDGTWRSGMIHSCTATAEYLDAETSTAKVMEVTDRPGHMRIEKAGPVNIEVRAACLKDAEIAVFTKLPSEPKTLPW